MLSFLIRRPVAVLMTTLALLIFSLLAAFKLPVSLLPNVDVPEIIIRMELPNASPAEIENAALSIVRERLLTLSHLSEMESKAGDEQGWIRLRFDYGTNMRLAYIECNEKIDRLASVLPRSMERPVMARVNTSDIPVLRIQVLPKGSVDLTRLSELSEKVIKKRLEQLEGVSLVDRNGLRSEEINLKPYIRQMNAFGLQLQDLEQVIRENNLDLGSLHVKDGIYRYYLSFRSKLNDMEALKALLVPVKDSRPVPLGQLADIRLEEQEKSTYHVFQQQEGIVFTIHKQAQAQMNQLVPYVYELLDEFEKDYGQFATFHITQDQSLLLNASIDNLQSSLALGGLFTFLILFLFLGNYRFPILIGISLPLSLCISLLVLYLLDVSINMISLSGLALGLGMLIDNAIIVMDNISRQKLSGGEASYFSGIVKGTEEVASPLLSSSLTTLAVFIPLVFLDGLTGTLFKDQAIAIASILSISLLVSLIIIPLLFSLFFKKKILRQPSQKPGWDHPFFNRLEKAYHQSFHWVMRRKALSFSIFTLLILALLLLTLQVPKEGLPPLKKTDTLLEIDWNEPISVEENKNRLEKLFASLPGDDHKNEPMVEMEIGAQQFLFQQKESLRQSASILIGFPDVPAREKGEAKLIYLLRQQYPKALFQIEPAPNAFDQLFRSSQSLLTMKLRYRGSSELAAPKQVKRFMAEWEDTYAEKAIPGPSLSTQTSIKLRIDVDQMVLHGIPLDRIRQQLERVFGNFLITEVKSFGQNLKVNLRSSPEPIEKKLRDHYITSESGELISLDKLLSYQYQEDLKFITADQAGVFQNFHWDERPSNFDKWSATALAHWHALGFDTAFSGNWFEEQAMLKSLLWISLVSIAMLYFILAAQFESLLQPLIVLLTLPMGLAGSLLALSLGGSSLNVMSGIGMVVMLGIMVNDAILKVDTANRYIKAKSSSWEGSTSELLEEAIRLAGHKRLKAICMTSITTILAVSPILFSSGIGADLQKPLVWSIIGGLSLGTFSALYCIPLLFCYLSNFSMPKHSEAS